MILLRAYTDPLPSEVLPSEVLPSEVLPSEVLPSEVFNDLYLLKIVRLFQRKINSFL